MTAPNKTYIGDSVYVEFDGFGLILTTDSGYGPNNTIYLEPATYESLIVFVASLKRIAKEQGEILED